jgi:hypothetical protein
MGQSILSYVKSGGFMIDSLSRWSWLGPRIFFSLLFMGCVLAGVVVFHHQDRGSNLLPEKQEGPRYVFPRPRHAMTGFRFDGVHEGKKTVSIQADRFVVDKKKLGFLRFGLMNTARLTNADIDIYGAGPDRTLHQTQKDLPDVEVHNSNRKTFGHFFSQKTFSSFPVKRVSSISVEPVVVRLHDETYGVTEISADSASIRMKKRKVLFKGRVRVASGSKVLTTDQLSLSPEDGTITCEKYFSLKTGTEQLEGQGLMTDVFLNTGRYH